MYDQLNCERLKSGRNCVSQERVGFGRKLAVISRAWFWRIVERAASRAWLCCSANWMACSSVMRTAADAPGEAGGCASAGLAARLRADISNNHGTLPLWCGKIQISLCTGAHVDKCPSC